MRRLLSLAAVAACLLAACSSSTPASAQHASAARATAAGRAHKILVIPLENHSRSQALRQMRHLAAWARRYGQATNYRAIGHPSLPNYLAIFGGSTFGITDDCSAGSSSCTARAPSVFGQTIRAGRTARAYQESMAGRCQQASSGSYAPRHSPWPYWPAERRACFANDVPLGTPARGPMHNDLVRGTLPVTGELTPNLCNDGHDCSLARADTWLARWVPAIMRGSDYRARRLTIIITFDEDDSSQHNTVAFVVIDPRLHGRRVTGAFNHYSLTRWLDTNAGVPLLRNAARARPLR
ncbi:MAG: alkaline phosphatase family protein, partial [Jatrophihabitantaceae bacterium]